jgi:hypothetical protein
MSLKILCIKLTKEAISKFGFRYCLWKTYSSSGDQNIVHQFKEPGSSLPCSQQTSIGPYPEPDETTPYPYTLFL